jgi:thiamine transporter ThiT
VLSRSTRITIAVITGVAAVTLYLLIHTLSGTAWWIAYAVGMGAALTCAAAAIHFHRRGM